MEEKLTWPVSPDPLVMRVLLASSPALETLALETDPPHHHPLF